MKSEITQQINSALREVLSLGDDTEILATSKLKDDLGLDSMSSLTFLMTLEENVDGFVVDPDSLEMSDLNTVESITSYVQREIGMEDSAKDEGIFAIDDFSSADEIVVAHAA